MNQNIHPQLNMGPAQLHYISTETIHSTHSTPPSHSTQIIELTPWDLQIVTVHPNQKGLLFRRPQHSDWLTRLKHSLSQTLHHFPPFTGCLSTRTHPEDHDTISLFINCNNTGAQFVHATVPLTISDILDPVYVPRVVHDFFPLNFIVNYDGLSQPLLAVQVTELVDGVFIGCTMNHVTGDGTSLWHFINSWSHVCKTGNDEIPLVPNFDRSSFTELPIWFPRSVMEKAIRYYYSLPPDVEDQVFHFTKKNIARLKERANLEYNNNNSTKKTTISCLQAVVSHMWLGVLRAMNLDPDEEVSYRLLMSNRSRLDPPLPEGYFGNSVSFGVATAKVGELMSGGLGFAAGLMNKAVSGHGNERIKEDWDKWVKQPKFTCFDNMGVNNLITGSSPRFNMYGNDFGWGSPIAVRSGWGNKITSKLTVFPGPTEGSMDFETSISKYVLMGLSQDPEFMKYVGTSEEEEI